MWSLVLDLIQKNYGLYELHQLLPLKVTHDLPLSGTRFPVWNRYSAGRRIVIGRVTGDGKWAGKKKLTHCNYLHLHVIGLIIAIGAMLIIPSAPGHVAKASTCSTSFGTHRVTLSSSFTTSGSCSAGVATGQTTGAGRINGGSKSSCTAFSDSQEVHGYQLLDSNGAVSCSSHSP